VGLETPGVAANREVSPELPLSPVLFWSVMASPSALLEGQPVKDLLNG